MMEGVNKNQSKFYMAWNKDPDVLKNSSSGGVFTALAEYVFSLGGVVFGAVLDPDSKKVEHVMAENECDMRDMRLSKYYQSETGSIYLKVKEILNKGKTVLFTGTACQIAALYKICGEPENLITADVLCHGVTSKFLVDRYIKSQEKLFKKTIKFYGFRVKDTTVGWEKGGGTGMKLEFSDDSTYVSEKGTDTFFVGFNNNLILRESCYHCKYCGLNRMADFTMADFWGVTDERATAEERRNGISLLLVNSERGSEILENLKSTLNITSIDPNEAIPHNRALTSPNICPEGRNKIFKLLRRGKDYNSVIKRFFPNKYLKAGLKHSAQAILGEERYKKIMITLKSTRNNN